MQSYVWDAMMEKKPFCRRCLLADMPSEAQLAKSIRELIDLLPEEKDREERVKRWLAEMGW